MNNIFVGVGAGIGNTTGDHNTFTGFYAGGANSSGEDNTAVGFQAGSGNTTGSGNTFVGSEAGWDNNTASFNTMVGNLAGYDNDADGNTFVGYSSGTNSVTGDENTYVGYMAGTTNSSGQLNAGLGSYAGASNTTGSFNVFTGYLAGDNNTTGSNNVFVGHNAQPSANNFTNAGAIGANAFVGASNSIVIGSINGVNGWAGTSTNVGIGLTTPAFRLDVGNGDVNVNTGDRGYRIGSDYVLWHNNIPSNIYVGVGAGNGTSTATENTFVGNLAGNGITTGVHNTFIGQGAGLSNTMGFNNVFMGESSGTTNTEGDQNVAIGHSAGTGNTTGNNNTFIGENAVPTANNLNNATAIGAFSTVAQDNSLILGSINGVNGAGATVNVGIGVNAPARRLEIVDDTDPQLRLTSSLTPLRVTDFQTTAGGDLLINASNSGASRNIGIAMNTAPISKLEINNTSMGTGLFSHTNFATSFVNNGVRGTSQGALLWNIGVAGQSPNNITFPGIPQLTLGGPAFNALPLNSGVVGQAQGSLFNFGGIFEANTCPNNAFNIGVYASARDGIFTSCGPGFAGFFQGHVFTTGAYLPPSDVKLKDSVGVINGALLTLASLKPKHYTFKRDSFPYMNMPPGKQFGLIAQEVDTILPELVHQVMQPQITDTSGAVVQDSMTIKAINYTGLIPLTIAAIQEQQAQIESKVSVCGLPGSTPAHYLPKWDSVNRVLCNSIVHDNGSAVGIPAAQAGSYFTVSNSSDTVAAMFTSANTGTVAVVKAVYNTNTANTGTAAVYGYSNYSNGGDADGIGGRFEGGKHGVYGLATGNTNQLAGILGEAQGAAFMNIGVMGKSADTADVYNVGVLGNTEGSEQVNVGTGGISEFANGTSVNLGVVGMAGGSQYENFGGNFEATDTVGLNYGVYAAVQDTDDYAGYFNGDVHIVGALTRGSDTKLKSNLQNIAADSSLTWLGKLEPKTYTYRREDYPSLTLPAGVQYGFTAQEVEKVLPHLVKDIIRPETRDLKGNITGQRVEYKGVDYMGFVPLLVGALKAQETKIEKQQTQIDSLKEVITDRLASIEQRLNGCCPTGASFKTEAPEGDFAANNISVELSNIQVIVLEQNVPNPFAEQTSISYYLPESVNRAQIVFTDVLGTVIKTADIKSGYGTVTVFAQNLNSGQYSYSLVVEGKVVESKKMVKQR